MVWTHQVVSPENQVQPESFYNGVAGSNLSSLGVQVNVGVPGSTDFRSHYESINLLHQHVQNSYPHVGVASSSVFPSTMYNPCISTTAVSRYVPPIQCFGLGNPQLLPLYHLVSQGSMDESGSSGSFSDRVREFIKRKNALLAGGHHFVSSFASSSSSANVPQNPSHRSWNTSFESNILPSTGVSNPPGYSSADGLKRSNYVFPAGHMSQSWIVQAANRTGGVPQWERGNAVANPPGGFVHSGTVDMPNGGLQGYQAGHSAIFYGPLPHFHRNPMHIMQDPALFNIQMQIPPQHCLSNNLLHHTNPSGNGLPLDPRFMAISSNSVPTFGPTAQPAIANQVNTGSLRIQPYEVAPLVDLSRLYEAGVDEHRDMRLDVDSMSYEELVALEERIGNVNTGFTESYIKENLKTSSYVPNTSCMPDQSYVENDACIICQEEYEAEELIGTLGCGHKYHVTCIKEWLMVKNLCPICKTTALPADGRSR
ncbi:probable E3 ubiquitin-protein ligase ZFP1 [Oryza brachyantha]|uniref:RING-type E3 ubiquitin transferase n=1 Tax=Oryza brachyantha TaxID=4533 RepID=J3M9R6_ORYBR|nr:probable E3 ubiquitin-protein ligase ZFP1 [Oryza brachyantha]XP_015693369.1 probable E3 ubiquitin-protein ligase ZFP1 [Oryza brachyantha]